MDERALIEGAFSEGYINILMATSTLAAGVNLPAGRVIIRSPYVGIDKLDAARYRQMCGRAGRSGHCQEGDSYLMIPKVIQHSNGTDKAVCFAPLQENKRPNGTRGGAGVCLNGPKEMCNHTIGYQLTAIRHTGVAFVVIRLVDIPT